MFEDVLTISIKDDLERVSTEKKERKKKKIRFNANTCMWVCFIIIIEKGRAGML